MVYGLRGDFDMGIDVAAIVPAAGQGKRLGARGGKLFVSCAGKPLLLHTLKTLHATPAIRWIVLVVRQTDRHAAEALVRRFRLSKVKAVVPGGPSRAASVMRGFAVLPDGARWIVIHDGARPCVSRALLERVIHTVKRTGAVACGLPASLTVKAVDPQGSVRLTLDRESLWFVQTPQAFRRDWFAQALAAVDHRALAFPDDAALLEWAGFAVRMIPGDPLNLKVTTKEDLLMAESILRLQRGGKVAK